MNRMESGSKGWLMALCLGYMSVTPTAACDTAGEAIHAADAIHVGDATTATPMAVTVSPSATGLVLEGPTVLWADGGEIRGLGPGGTVMDVVAHPATQKEPTVLGELIVWADDRDGNFDLWARRGDGPAAALVTGPANQHQPVLDRHDGVTRLAWVDGDGAAANIWAAEVDLDADGVTLVGAKALTSDLAQQGQPHLATGRVVWADYRNDPDGAYLDISNPTQNNADIYGHDLVSDTPFTVTTDPSKQLRPAIDGDDVVWMDWRGINPEPKYSEFKIYTLRMSEGIPREVAWSGWDRDGLWQGPAVRDGVVLFIAEGGASTRVMAVPVTGGSVTEVQASAGVLEAVALSAERVAWLGGGELHVRPVDDDARAAWQAGAVGGR